MTVPVCPNINVRKIKFTPGKIYHILNRGVEKRPIFNGDSDKWRFLQGLYLFNDENSSHQILYNIEKENKGRINFNLLKEFVNDNLTNRDPLIRIMAICLMPNHYHLLVEELQENGIPRFMHKFGVGYASFFNKKYNRVGPLFQGRFKAVEIENDLQLQYILAYINVINPAQLIEPEIKERGIADINKVTHFTEEYSWSTHPDYLGIRDSIIIDKGIFNKIFPTPEKYKEFIKDILLSRRYNSINKFLE